MSLEGYSDPENRVSEGVHDRLDARALVLESGSKRLVLVSCEVNRSGFGPEASETVIEASVKLLNSVR